MGCGGVVAEIFPLLPQDPKQIWAASATRHSEAEVNGSTRPQGKLPYPSVFWLLHSWKTESSSSLSHIIFLRPAVTPWEISVKVRGFQSMITLSGMPYLLLEKSRKAASAFWQELPTCFPEGDLNTDVPVGEDRSAQSLLLLGCQACGLPTWAPRWEAQEGVGTISLHTTQLPASQDGRAEHSSSLILVLLH